MGVEERVEKLEHIIKGNGEEGIVTRLKLLERTIWKDDRTHSRGMVFRVEELEKEWQSFKTWLKVFVGLLATNTLTSLPDIIAFVTNVLGFGNN